MADDFELKFNSARIIAAAESVFSEANMILGRQFQKRITDNIWPWPRGDSPRDIVAPNGGQLRDSYTPEAVSRTEHLHPWNTDYAMAVHEGAVRGDGHTMPARPWVRVTLRDFDFAAAFGKLATSALAKVQDP